MSVEEGFRCGHVAVVGRPNVGKSTLVNWLVGEKLSITSARPQTTRNRILGIKTLADAQIVYVDTPGMHAGRSRALNRLMNRTAVGALTGVDVVVHVVEAGTWEEEDALVAERIESADAPRFLAINKVDRLADKSALLPFITACAGRGDYAEIVPLSARTGDNVTALEEAIRTRLPPGEAEFPADQFTDRSERFMAAEIVREKLIRRLGQEVPHRLSVEVEQFASGPTLTRIGAVVWVERRGQKAIVIGRRGELLKRAGTDARKDLEGLLGGRVHLEIWVKVRSDWTDDERLLARFGYDG